jgi:hypothetical protein
MKSWASIVKNTPATVPPHSVAAAAAAPTSSTAQKEGDIFFLQQTKVRSKNGGGGAGATGATGATSVKEKKEKEITSSPPTPAHEPQEPQEQEPTPTTAHHHAQPSLRTENSRPEYKTVSRPDAPTVVPIFKDEDHKRKWYDDEYKKDYEYSQKIHHQEMEKWRTEKRWHVVPNMTEMTKEQEAAGFRNIYKPYYEREQEQRVSERCPGFIPPSDYGYLIPWNSAQMTDTFADFLATLFFNRADELCRCRTVEDFEKVYNAAAELQWSSHFSDWKWKVHQEYPAEKALWTMSTNANMWPGKTIVPHPRPDDLCGVSGSASALSHFGIKKTPKYEVHTVKRGQTGICNVKDLKTLGKKAPIRWYVSPAFLKNMKRFQFIFEDNPNQRVDYDSDDWFGDW